MTRSWKPQWRIDVVEIDAQHEGLFDRFDTFIEAASASQHVAGPAAEDALRFLAAYVDEHFADEERAMAAAGYPALVEHREMHRSFVKELEELSGRFRERGASPSLLLALANLFESWLTLHITRVDQKFGDYLRVRRAAGG